ncbi:hypothetical protein KRR26_06630 [Corallococcus sp. M34]|nr:hypothetical protein [Citreicoccus inhibens]
MLPKWGGALLLGFLLVGCATSRAVRLDTGQGTPIVYTPPTRASPVEIHEREFRRAMAMLLLDMRFSLRPTEERTPPVQRASWDTSDRHHGQDYDSWCFRQVNPGECRALLGRGLTLMDGPARRDLALSFAWDGVWAGAQDVVSEVINPLALKVMITSAMATYMLLVVAPEPITKLVAIALTTYVIAYIGLEAFTSLVKGWQQLTFDSERALTFDELEDAGHRFGQVMGQNGARVLILALTAALGGGASNMASKGPMLPGFASAALAAETNIGIQVSAAMSGGVRAIALTEGALAVSLAPNAVAMAVHEGAAGNHPPASTSEHQGKLLANQQPRLLATELETAQRLGIRPASSTDPAFLQYVNEGRIKWVVTEEGVLRIVPHSWRGIEISHAVASNGRSVLAAGEADIAVHGGSRVGIEISSQSGHYLNGASSAVSARALEIGRQAFANLGIIFPP